MAETSEHPIPTHVNFKNLTGRKFGRLTVIRYSHRHVCPSGQTKSIWECLCELGKTTFVFGESLYCGTKSCGCLVGELARINNATHGGARRSGKNAAYHVWSNMIDRCYQPKNKRFPRYGGRGIKVCPRWRRSFGNFLADMGPRPSFAHSIDRFPNQDGDYEPGNCRWATNTEQARNKSNNYLITYRDKTQCLSAWCEELNIPYARTILRISRREWSIEDAFTIPGGSRRPGVPNRPRKPRVTALA